ncbi:hypothetical protein GCM10011514_22370 [Emticicia aquatilis]|uniref:Uncharacterized protein n=1 Tax=Emticicia aquatilis TaxID=1537369 RepID=A0A917DQT9_9BACT|nr:hypothetical protein [Emticicia aquatilis]GGD57797.1 hypothetical protein GCM10011514_22370 [Emticicia aquatilis]
MKKIIFTFLLTSFSAFVFGQNVTLTPTSIQNTVTNDLDNIVLTKYNLNDGGYIIGRNASGTPAAPGASNNDSWLLYLGAKGHTGSGFTSNRASIILRTNQAWSTTANGTNIWFNTTANNTTNSLLRMIINDDGNVGIGSHTPLAKLHVDGDFALKKKVLLSGNGGHLNFDRAGASIISVDTPANGGGGETINSIAGGIDGMIVYVYPVQGTSVTIVNEDAASTAANRIITYTAANVTILNNGGCTLLYDGTVQRWRMISVAN